ncbi:predicted protein [Plenodomus lingam JN3]|uniref:Predicted protein n=1 Tax=Leptosphaeria maculans (strain JN3 / isolate v23.1.3 / race Av1-4-5-6-7-8) TaxID=985895 RepID=E4ZTZ8_LEPMJ|nr:predicted protein [Plenodomus lingam JN3]CBX94708.1 predicted protein [Plenodomus lingam JN3]
MYVWAVRGHGGSAIVVYMSTIRTNNHPSKGQIGRKLSRKSVLSPQNEKSRGRKPIHNRSFGNSE